VRKDEKQALRDVTINDGLHFHAIAFIPRRSRLKCGLRKHFKKKQIEYVKNKRSLDRVEAKRIKDWPEYVTDYVIKAFKRGNID
jgi:hypothetical protein